jgi:hypothetical protein
MPTNVPIVDIMLGVPEENQKGVYDFVPRCLAASSRG